jgi:selenocysteine-specific elongation factor
VPARATPGKGSISRAFTIRRRHRRHGHLRSGSIAAGDELRIEPSGLRTRARSVQVHDVQVERAEAGQRVAVNLPGISRSQLQRGDVLVEPGAYPVSWRLDVVLEELEPLPAALTVHIGTSDVPARVVREGRYAQLRLREPVVAARGDRVVLRTETTVGGGTVLDPSPRRRFEPQRLELLERGDPESIVARRARRCRAELRARTLAPAELAQGSPRWKRRRVVLGSRAAHCSPRRLAERASSSPPGIPFSDCCRRALDQPSPATWSAVTARPTLRAPRRSSAIMRLRRPSSRPASPTRTLCGSTTATWPASSRTAAR